MKTQPKWKVKLTDPPQFMCGWCGKWDIAENLRRSMPVHTGNDWPIHPACYMDWYDGEPRPVQGSI